MANENLTHKLTAEELRKGGQNSGKSRREKAMISKYLNDWLSDKAEYKDKDGKTKKMTGAEAAAMKLIQKFMRDGDLRAFELLRDTAGQKPVEKVMIAEVEQSVIDEVEAMVMEDDES